MKIRKVEALYSLKTSKGLIPRGIYSVDAPGGIPEVVLNEAVLGRKTVRILEREPIKKTVEYIGKKQEETVVTTLDEPKKEENILDEVVKGENTLDEKESQEVKEEPTETILDEPKPKKKTRTKKSETSSDESKPKKKIVRKRKPATKKKE